MHIFFSLFILICRYDQCFFEKKKDHASNLQSKRQLNILWGCAYV